jgi:hypothetical protein
MSENDCVVSLSPPLSLSVRRHETAKARSAGVTGIVANFAKGAPVPQSHRDHRKAAADGVYVPDIDIWPS